MKMPVYITENNVFIFIRVTTRFDINSSFGCTVGFPN